MITLPNFNKLKSIGSQKKDMFKEIELMKSNALLLAQRKKDYYKDNMPVENITQNFSTEELMGNLIKLREQFRVDLKELSPDTQIINEVIGYEKFNELEYLQIIIQIFPSIKFKITQGKEQQRFMSASFIIKTIENIVEDWKKENDIKETKDILVPELVEKEIPVPVVNENNVDSVLTSSDYIKKLDTGSALPDLYPFEFLEGASYKDQVDKFMDYLNKNNMIGRMDDGSFDNNDVTYLESEIVRNIDIENGYSNKFELTSLFIEKEILERNKKIIENQIGTKKTLRSADSKLNDIKKDIAINKINYKAKEKEIETYKKDYKNNLKTKNNEVLQEYKNNKQKLADMVNNKNNKLQEQKRREEEERKRLEEEKLRLEEEKNKRLEEEERKRIEEEKIRLAEDINKRNYDIDKYLGSSKIKKEDLKIIADKHNINVDMSKNKPVIIAIISEELKKKPINWKPGPIGTTETFGFGFINKDGVYVPNKRIGKGFIDKDGVYVPNNHIGHKNIKIGRGLEIPEEKKPVYLQFGNFIIHQKQLFEDNILNLKYKTMGSTLIKRQVISQNLSDLIKHIIEYGKIQQKDYDHLSDNDKKLFDDVIDKALLRDIIKYNRVSFGNGIKNADMVNINDEIKRFTLLKGIISAGNDNKDLINEFKGLLKKFIDNNRINSNEGNIILNML
jgi:hypothetical protein